MNSAKQLLAVIVMLCLIYSCKMPPGMRSGYYTEKDTIVYYTGFPSSRYVLEDLDTETFVSINDGYGKDKNKVYSGYNVIENADPSTFEFLGGPFSKDRNNAYFDDKVLSSNGPGFHLIKGQDISTGFGYASDGSFVFQGDMKLENADPSSFTYVAMFNGNYLTYDRNNVYFNNHPIQDANGSGFKKLSGFYFTDNKNVWALMLGKDTHWKQIPDADASSIKAVKEYYVKDSKHVFYEDRIVKDADVNSFTETTGGEASDNKGSYNDGILLKK
ncbi:MAG: DKNYY domain-containing protein [bacterium]